MVRRSFGVGAVRAIAGFTGSLCPGAGLRSATRPQPATRAIAVSVMTRVNFMTSD
jgi:hypothetical protein